MGARSTGNFSTSTKADGHLLEFFRSNMGVGGGGAAIADPRGIEATGGSTTTYNSGGNGYKSHTFNSSATFNVTQTALGTIPNSLEILIISGGGGGGGGHGGGGGGGGFRTVSVEATGGNKTITIGGGGSGGPGNSQVGGTGNPSSFGAPTPISADGGGGGGSYSGIAATNGGSGGGGGGSNPGTAGAATNYPGPTQQGYPGGTNTPNTTGHGAGGGGAGAVGGDASGGQSSGGGGNGGNGADNDYKTGSNITYAGGGGGGAWSSRPRGSGGTGGGGRGRNAGGASDNGTTNTGGGGGGGGDGDQLDAKSGGSGVVVIRYRTS